MKEKTMTREISKWGERTGEMITCTETKETELTVYGYRKVWISKDGRKFINRIKNRGRFNCFEELF